MRNALYALLFLGYFISCQSEKEPVRLKTGVWQGQITVQDDQKLPFNFTLDTTATKGYVLQIVNGTEVIEVDEIRVDNDSILIKAPVFDGYITASYTAAKITGRFIIESMDRSMAFEAIYGEENRFPDSQSPTTNVTGIWETVFSPNTDKSYLAKGIFTQNNGTVTGTFRTNTGDYRFLDGVMDGDSLKLSAFDGAHVFLFQAKATDSSLNGTFYSGNHFKEPFTAKRNEAFELASPDSLTFIKEGYSGLDFSFPDTSGNLVSLSDKTFKDKVVIVQIMGTWCPNCLDETQFLVQYLNTYKNEDLAIVGLAFEYAKTETLAFKSIERLTDRVGVPYPILLAQYGTSDKGKAQEKLPMLNHILSYPTTIFMDRQGKVRRIHTGFNGPATGEKYEAFKSDFDRFVNTLLAE